MKNNRQISFARTTKALLILPLTFILVSLITLKVSNFEVLSRARTKGIRQVKLDDVPIQPVTQDDILIPETIEPEPEAPEVVAIKD